MFLFKRLAPFLISVLNLVGLEILLKNPGFIWWLPPVMLVLILGLVFLVAKQPSGILATARFLLVFFLFFTATVLSLLFVSSPIIQQLMVFVSSLVIAFLLECLFLFLYLPERYKAYSLENLNNLVNILTFLLLNVAIFAFIVFMNLRIWQASLGILVVSVILFILSFRANKINTKGNEAYLLVGGLVILELFIGLTWLPFNFYLKAVLLAVVYYVLNGIFRLVLLNNLSTKLILRYVFIFLGVWFLALMTARWT